MGKSNWNISGNGGQAVIDVGGSKRCQLSGTKYMLWNARNNLTDCEVVATIKPWTNENGGRQVGAMILRSDDSIYNYYKLMIYAYTNYRKYAIYRIVNGVATLLSQVISYQGYNIYVKTRFRVDGFQLSVEEYISGTWNLITTVEDTDHSIISGYVGIGGNNYSTSYSFLFDDVEISEK